MMPEDHSRVGVGFDIHRLVEGRRLVLGGVVVPYEKGLLGHSDADVVLHALTDAILGAAAMPDIGEMFPDTDPRYRDADSRELLTEVVNKVAMRGLSVGNTDVVVHAEAPKLSAHKRDMIGTIAKLLGVPAECVSVKAKTNEGFGAIGCGDAIACTAVVLLVRRSEPQLPARSTRTEAGAHRLPPYEGGMKGG